MNSPASYQNILLIDDDQDDQDLFALAVGKITSHTNCLSELSADTALKKLQADELTPDFIFLDLNIPGMTGMEFLREIKKDHHLSKIPIVILTTSMQTSAKTATLGLGARDFLTKPNSLSELITLLSRHLR